MFQQRNVPGRAPGCAAAPENRRYPGLLAQVQVFSENKRYRQSLGWWLLRYALDETSPISFDASEINRAIERGFAPWLARAMETHGQSVTAKSQEGLKLAARAAALQARDLQQRLAGIVDQAAGREIPVCLLKGAALEPWLYPGPGFRPMADVDLLVTPARQHQFEQLLAEQGYVQRSQFPGPWPADMHHSMPFWHPQQGNWIEVHTRLSPSVANVLLTDQECFDYHGTKANRLRAQSQILYTVAHWAGRFLGPDSIISLLDLVLLLRHAGLPDLERFDFDAPQRAWLRRALGVACLLLPKSAIPANLPFPEGLEAWRWRRLIGVGERYILDDEPFGRWHSPGFADARWKALMDTPSNTIAILREPWWCLFPPREEGRFSPRTLYSRMSRLWRKDL